jgi:CHASE3 domain sensor protein
VEITPLSILSASVIVLLLIVTGGVVYLTLADWRDRRRLENEKREARRR